MSAVYTRLVSGAVFPLQERLKNHKTAPVRRAMEKSQWWSTDQLREYQIRALRDFLADVDAHVPFFRSLFKKCAFVPATVTSTADLAALPFLTKATIRSNIDGLKADDARHLARFNTGGSSGEPLTFLIGTERISHDVAAKWRATRWWNVDIGDPEVVIWGSPIELNAQDRVRLLRDRIMRTELLSAFEMSDAKLSEFVARIRKRRPRMLFGYPSALSLIARHAEKRGIVMDDLGIRVAFVTAERLYDNQRRTISRIFGCPVANGYGGRDAGFIAHECPAGGMHITAEDIIVEIVSPQGEVLPVGQAGEIVTTHLATRDFPFIRYRTGDIGVLDEKLCVCGRGLPLLREVQGRSTDFLIAADGAVMHGLALVYPIRELSGIEEFKVVQESLELTRVLLVRDKNFDEANPERIRNALKCRLGAMVEIRVEFVNSIPAEVSGKYRYVVSNVNRDMLPRSTTVS